MRALVLLLFFPLLASAKPLPFLEGSFKDERGVELTVGPSDFPGIQRIKLDGLSLERPFSYVLYYNSYAQTFYKSIRDKQRFERRDARAGQWLTIDLWLGGMFDLDWDRLRLVVDTASVSIAAMSYTSSPSTTSTKWTRPFVRRSTEQGHIVGAPECAALLGPELP